MTTLSELKSPTEAAMRFRGHGVVWHPPSKGVSPTDSRIVQTAVCPICDAWATVDTHPYPNGIDIGGTAVALDCPVSPVGCDGRPNTWSTP